MRTIKPLFGLAMLAAFIYVCWEMVPPYFNNYQFQDYLNERAREASYLNVTEEQIRDSVMKEARNDHIPITPDQVRVNKTNLDVSIAVDYSVHVDLPVFPQDLHFSVSSHNRGI